MEDLLQVLVSGLSQGAVYALMALGLTFIYRSTTVLNFAHGENFMLGAFATVVLIEDGVPYLLAVAIAVVALLAVGVLLDKIAFEPLLERDHVTQVFATIAVSVVIKGLVRRVAVDERGVPPLLDVEFIRVGSAVLNPQHVLTVLALVIVSVFFWFLFLRTGLGRILRASTQSLRGAMLVGIDVRTVFAAMWGIGAAVGAIAGILAAPTLLFSPDMGARPLLLGFAAMALGGFGSFVGAVVGGVLLGLIQIAAGFYVSTTLGDLSGFLLIFVVLVVRPEGIFKTSESAAA